MSADCIERVGRGEVWHLKSEKEERKGLSKIRKERKDERWRRNSLKWERKNIVFSFIFMKFFHTDSPSLGCLQAVCGVCKRTPSIWRWCDSHWCTEGESVWVCAKKKSVGLIVNCWRMFVWVWPLTQHYVKSIWFSLFSLSHFKFSVSIFSFCPSVVSSFTNSIDIWFNWYSVLFSVFVDSCSTFNYHYDCNISLNLFSQWCVFFSHDIWFPFYQNVRYLISKKK